MRDKLLHPATVIATIALIVALGGTSYAAGLLPRDSVGNRQLRADSVTSGKVRNGSLLAKDFRSGQLPSGAQGPAGPAVADWTPVEVDCPAGKKALGGGAEALGQTTALRKSAPNATDTGWLAVKGNSSGGASLSVWVICAATS